MIFVVWTTQYPCPWPRTNLRWELTVLGDHCLRVRFLVADAVERVKAGHLVPQGVGLLGGGPDQDLVRVLRLKLLGY